VRKRVWGEGKAVRKKKGLPTSQFLRSTSPLAFFFSTTHLPAMSIPTLTAAV
jgi:hypothetical protein